MRFLSPVFALALLWVAAPGLAQQTPANAPVATNVVARSQPIATAELLASAQTRAKAEGKNVLVLFHASWCKWCKKLEAFMADPKYKPIFEENFVTVELTVLESDKKKADENPGGIEKMVELGGKDAGLPFFAILDPEGRTVINSLRPVEGKEVGENTGFPAAPEEVAHFIAMMRKGAPKVTQDQLKAMEAFLTAKPVQQGAGGR